MGHLQNSLQLAGPLTAAVRGPYFLQRNMRPVLPLQLLPPASNPIPLGQEQENEPAEL